MYDHPTSSGVLLRLVCPSCLCLRQGRKLSEEKTRRLSKLCRERKLSFARGGRFRGSARYLITLQHGASDDQAVMNRSVRNIMSVTHCFFHSLQKKGVSEVVVDGRKIGRTRRTDLQWGKVKSYSTAGSAEGREMS